MGYCHFSLSPPNLLLLPLLAVFVITAAIMELFFLSLLLRLYMISQ
jgi:hypothetical protein